MKAKHKMDGSNIGLAIPVWAGSTLFEFLWF